MGHTAIDIIVPVYKNAKLAGRCLDSLAENIHEISACDPRLIVINDSPGEDDVRDVLALFASRHSYVTVLENEQNLGFVGSVNRGLAIASEASRDIILVNADTETFQDTLKNLTRAAHADPQIGFASPRSNNAAFCSLPHLNEGVVIDQTESHRRWRLLSRTMPAFHFAPTAVGFYLYIKNNVIANFGFLDPEFGLGYEEENDLILRANKAGYRAVVVNNAFAFHAGSASFNLLDMNLQSHRAVNLEKTALRHAEYLPLIRRYEESAHFRAERLISQGLTSATERLKLVFDLSSIGPSFDGTSEMSVAIIDAFYERKASVFDINVICTEEVFKFHKLDRHDRLLRHDVDLRTSSAFAIGVRLSQPFNIHSVSHLEELSVINIYGMLDTIADDCGYLAITHKLEGLWGHVVRHANGLFFNSQFSERALIARYPDARHAAKYARLLPTQLSDYKTMERTTSADHVLVMGNHFAHKAADSTAEILKEVFPAVTFVAIGKQNRVSGNLRTYQSGSLDKKQMGSLYARARIVVLPSHIEGFGFGLMHALAAGKVVVARDIPATREILATYKAVSGVFLYANDGEVVRALRLAMSESGSHVQDDSAESWSDWVDGFAEFCSSLARQDDIFERLVRRIQSGDLIRKAELLERLQAAPPLAPVPVEIAKTRTDSTNGRILTDAQGRKWLPVRRIRELLGLDGEEFVYRAYVTILNRLPDSDGLVNYLTELQSGATKLDVISRLRNSTEGRRAPLPLRGYRSAIARTRLLSLLSLST